MLHYLYSLFPLLVLLLLTGQRSTFGLDLPSATILLYLPLSSPDPNPDNSISWLEVGINQRWAEVSKFAMQELKNYTTYLDNVNMTLVVRDTQALPSVAAQLLFADLTQFDSVATILGGYTQDVQNYLAGI